MLLVALVALGSASFAWYYTNATVQASTSSYKAAVDSGLVIRHTNADAWGPEVTNLLNNTTGLTPASITYASTLSSTRGGTAKSGAYNSSTISGDPTKQTIENGNYFLVDSFFVASDSNSAQTASFTITGGSAANGRYLNLAVYVNGTLRKVLTNDNEFAAATGFGKFKNAETGDGVEVDTNKYAEEGKVAKFTSSVDMGTISATAKGGDDTGCRIDIVGFADGFNANCKSDSVNTDTLSLTYSFTATA